MGGGLAGGEGGGGWSPSPSLTLRYEKHCFAGLKIQMRHDVPYRASGQRLGEDSCGRARATERVMTLLATAISLLDEPLQGLMPYSQIHTYERFQKCFLPSYYKLTTNCTFFLYFFFSSSLLLFLLLLRRALFVRATRISYY